MNLDDIHRGVKKHKKRKRVGRGPGSGHGKTSGRGHKGQGQLAGWSASPIFEGGASPLIRRIPKRGFHNQFAKTVAIVNLGALDKAFKTGDEVTVESLREKDLAKGRYDELKVLGEGQLTVSAQTPDVGEASDALPVPFAGEPLEIGFNPEFLIAGLESAGSQDVTLKLISPLRPGLIESADGSGFLYLIMPIRLNV